MYFRKRFDKVADDSLSVHSETLLPSEGSELGIMWKRPCGVHRGQVYVVCSVFLGVGVGRLEGS